MRFAFTLFRPQDADYFDRKALLSVHVDDGAPIAATFRFPQLNDIPSGADGK